jgi:hypothetical protein
LKQEIGTCFRRFRQVSNNQIRVTSMIQYIEADD